MDSFSKKERQKNLQKKRREKAEKKEERKANAGKKSFEDMLAYVDENGNITSTPPDPTKKREEVNAEEIELGVPRRPEETPEDRIRSGVVTFFNDDKGYGFIKDQVSQQSVFVHANNLMHPIKQNDKVTFETQNGRKGPEAFDVKVVK
jgi:cold shock CspA family protein